MYGLMQSCWLSYEATSYSVMVSIFLCDRKVVGSTPTAKLKPQTQPNILALNLIFL